MTWASLIADPRTLANYVLPGLTLVAVASLIATFKIVNSRERVPWYCVIADMVLTVIGLGITYGPDVNNTDWLPMGACAGFALLASVCVRPRPATS